MKKNHHRLPLRQRLNSRARFIYNRHLEPHIWYPDGQMNKLVSNSLQMIIWSYIAYMQSIGYPIADTDVHEIFIHGSSTNYYYDDTSDIDICIVADLGRMQSLFTGCNINALIKGALGSWKRNYDIRVCGRGIDIEVVDVATPRYGENIYKVGSAYSLARDQWIRRPVLLKPDEIKQIRRDARKQYKEMKKLYKQVRRNKMSPEFIETFLNRMTAERKESYAQNPLQPVTATTMAFRMARRCGMLRKLRQMATELRSREFNLKL